MQDSESYCGTAQLPNMMFSRALGLFLWSHERSDRTLAKRANQRLRDAVLAYPTMLVHLLDRCSVEPDSTVAKSPLYKESSRQVFKTADLRIQIL